MRKINNNLILPLFQPKQGEVFQLAFGYFDIVRMLGSLFKCCEAAKIRLAKLFPVIFAQGRGSSLPCKT